MSAQPRGSRITPEGQLVGRPTNRHIDKLDAKSLADYLLALSRQRGELNANDPEKRTQALEMARIKAVALGLFSEITGDE